MDVVLDATDPVEVAFQVFVNAPEVREEIVAAVLRDGRDAVFCCENEVVDELGVRVCHTGWVSPLRGFRFVVCTVASLRSTTYRFPEVIHGHRRAAPLPKPGMAV